MGGVISRVLFQPPDPPSYKDNKDGTIKWIKLENGSEIPTTFLKFKKSDQCILYSHGNATDLGQMMPYLELLSTSLKINVFSYEYQGYGIDKENKKTTISPTEKGCYDSIEAAVKYLTETLNFKRNKIIVFGTSLGSGPSTYICSRQNSQFRGLILQSPFLSVVRIKVPVQNKLFFDMFPNVERIERVESPVFVIHGKEDELIPTLSKKCKKSYKPLFIEYAGHNNIMDIYSVERYLKKIYDFLKYLNVEEEKSLIIEEVHSEEEEEDDEIEEDK
eukprot:gene2878-4721_t